MHKTIFLVCLKDLLCLVVNSLMIELDRNSLQTGHVQAEDPMTAPTDKPPSSSLLHQRTAPTHTKNPLETVDEA